MRIISYILIFISIAILIHNFWMYAVNVKKRHHDEMGAGMNFGIGYILAILPLFLALFVHPEIKWWWGVMALSSIIYGPPILRPVLHLVLKKLGLADRV